MLRVLTIAAVVGVAAAQTCACDKPGDSMSTLDHLKKALAEKGGLMAKWGEDCKKESAETADWLKVIEGNSAANAADFKAREADKGKLAGALEDRIGGLKVFIGQLEDILNKLGYHIQRTNQIYGTKYDANLQDQTSASLSLHDLSLDFAAPHNVRLNPIQQVKDWKAEAATDEAAAPAAAEPTPAEGEAKLMFLEAKVQERVAICHGPGCANAYQKSFALYKLGYKHNMANKKNFESERDTLGMMRKKTRAMLDKKKAKLKKLNEQLTKLKAAMAAPDGNLAELFPLIKEHQTIFDDSCKAFGTSSISGKEALTALLGAIQAADESVKKEDAKEAVEAPGATGAAEPETPAPEAPAAPAPKGPAPNVPKGDEDLTKILESPAATGGKF
jgi:hypothetical protein